MKAGSFDTESQTEFCKKVYGLFVYNVVDFLNMLAMEIPWMKSLLHWLHIPINKSVRFINDKLLNLIQHKKQEGTNNRMSNLVDFMSHALAQEECKIGGRTFDSVEGLSEKEFLMTQSIGLFVVANDTNSTFISHLFYELSHNMDVQQRLQGSILILQCHLRAKK